ncbi:hypothetical protein FKW77_006443 [Venturia effusa]|uniref:Uncharacterized protein n=1 Tax=Venturia effusa TaxID=50376 RepID=A0A517KZK8_9PEZI|nr:hypothetical protein FKW77_006443 [Venturia effusa]
MVSALTASSILENYSSSQLVTAGNEEVHVEGMPGKQAIRLEHSLLPAPQSPTLPLLPPKPYLKPVSGLLDPPPLDLDGLDFFQSSRNHISPKPSLKPMSGPPGIPPLDLDALDISQSSGNYISPRSRWSITTSDLLTKEEQTTVAANFTNEALTQENLAAVKELRQYIRDSSAPPTRPSTSMMSTPGTDLSASPTRSSTSRMSTLRTDFSSEPKSCLDTDYISETLSEEPCCISETLSSSDHIAASERASSDLDTRPTSSASSTHEPVAEDEEKVRKIDNETQEISQEQCLPSGVFFLSNPLFRQALQLPPDEEEEEEEEEEDAKDETDLTELQPHNKSPTPSATISNPHPLPDPVLLDVLAKTKDDTSSGEEMRSIRKKLVTKVLNRNIEKWSGSGGIDDLDRRIMRNRRMYDRPFLPGVGWLS